MSMFERAPGRSASSTVPRKSLNRGPSKTTKKEKKGFRPCIRKRLTVLLFESRGGGERSGGVWGGGEGSVQLDSGNGG